MSSPFIYSQSDIDKAVLRVVREHEKEKDALRDRIRTLETEVTAQRHDVGVLEADRAAILREVEALKVYFETATTLDDTMPLEEEIKKRLRAIVERGGNGYYIRE